jgi:ribosomal protein S27AE
LFVADKLKVHTSTITRNAKKLGITPTQGGKLYEKDSLELIVKNSFNIKEVLDKLNKVASQKSYEIIRNYIDEYKIDTSHFDSYKKNKGRINVNTTDINSLLQIGTKIGSSHLKDKLYKAGLKERKCEKCGQGEIWNGAKMSLILDHINGISNDNRIENLRILCPNCAATLPTHCRGHKGLKYAPIV